MKALILAGGKGTRLRPLTVYTPKPVVPVLNRPFLLYQLEILRRAGIDDIVLSLNYQPDKIKILLGDGAEYGVRLSYVTEPSPMGTAGAVGYSIGDLEDTIVLNGDILTDLVVDELLAAHRQSGADATLCLTPIDNPSAYGMVDFGEDGIITGFTEKPAEGEFDPTAKSYINAGIYVLSPKVLELIEKDKKSSFEYDIFPKAISNGLTLNSYRLDDLYWQDIGTPEKYLSAHHDFQHGLIKRFHIERRSESAEIAPEADICKRSIIGDECVIKPNAKIRNSVIGDSVHIEENAVIEDSVIWSHSRVSDSCQVRSAVLGKGVYLGKSVSVSAGTVLGDKASLTDYTLT